MIHFRKTFMLVFIIASTITAEAQTLKQTIRGNVVDKISKTALPGASVVVINSEPLIGSTTDPDGNFKLPSIAVGMHSLKISFVGYKELTLPNIIVNSGKEVVLTIFLEEDITQLDEIVVRPAIEKNKPLNDMATVSTRTFSVEETRKFAAAVNDPARAAVSFAGVVSTNDGNNSISIRGNSPFGLLWRLEGVDIPNPNHFAGNATSGGGISILSSQLLSNSDFSTGAFAVEYGNALAGVFDLNFRKGNNEKAEYTIQAGFLGTDIAAEGPFSKNYRGSYLINYRYSTLSILSKLGVEVGDAVTNFQDLSFNIYLPTNRYGNFSLFGFGGLSDQKQSAKKDSSKWENEYQRYNADYFSNTAAAGAKHALTINSNTYLQSALVISGYGYGYEDERLNNDYNPQFNYHGKYLNKKITLSSILNQKINAHHSFRSGVYINRYAFNFVERYLDRDIDQVVQPLNTVQSLNTLQVFSQWNYRVNNNLTFNTGLHSLYLTNNGSFSLEPRFSVKYDLSEQQSFSVGYGMHSQMQPIGVYEAEIETNGLTEKPNQSLGFNKAHHFVVGYDRSLTKYLRIKTETYFQYLYNIAVKDDPTSSTSSLVVEQGFITDPMINKGVGRNYGVELTVEQFLRNDMYFLLSASLYDSKYKALDNIWRNTRFNGNRAFSFSSGKEFNWKKNRVFGVNARILYSGGFRTTPIDFELSEQLGETRYIETLAFSEQLPDYFRADLRLSLKRNKERSTTALSLDFQNVSNHKNLGGQYYEPLSGEIKKWYMMPLLPILSYKVEF